jgi:propionyl-CoA synthetase
MSTSRYQETYARWKADPQAFWAEAAKAIDWIRPADAVFDAAAGVYGRWFPGAVCNTCWNAVDRHVPTRGAQTAIIYDSPVTGTKRRVSYSELQAEVAALAAVIRDLGVGKGDRVVVYMPMIPEALMAMLACARIGAVHSVVFGGFAAKELATRLDDAKPKLVIAASCGIEPNRVVAYKPLLDEAISLLVLAKPASVLLLQRPQADAPMTEGRDHDWAGSSPPPGRRPRRPSACPSPRPTRSTSSTPPAPPASPRAWCATMAATWSRSPGPWTNLYGMGPARCSGRPRMSAGSSATATSSMRR